MEQKRFDVCTNAIEAHSPGAELQVTSLPTEAAGWKATVAVTFSISDDGVPRIYGTVSLIEVNDMFVPHPGLGWHVMVLATSGQNVLRWLTDAEWREVEMIAAMAQELLPDS